VTQYGGRRKGKKGSDVGIRCVQIFEIYEIKIGNTFVVFLDSPYGRTPKNAIKRSPWKNDIGFSF
jgi:hypothetical protein